MPEGRTSLEYLFSAMYEELRRLASTVSRGDPSDTLNPTALVNEAYLKLADTLRVEPVSKLHFRRIAARAMRQVLVEAARRRSALKRGGGRPMVTLDDGIASVTQSSEEILALDAALEDLEAMHPRQAQLVEIRFFGGFNVTEAAELLQVSESTVERDWRAARAWLATQVRQAL
jgi:RNA polymerase sigma factor (TIGR02999 family)